MRLDDRIAIITDAGRGIGRAIALAFAGADADVVLVSRSGDELEAVAEEVRELGRRALPVVADVSVEGDVERVVAETLGAFDRIDVLVNNAGIDAPELFIETAPEDWARVRDVNFTGVLLCTQSGSRIGGESLT